jgi:hypothetical protein
VVAWTAALWLPAVMAMKISGRDEHGEPQRPSSESKWHKNVSGSGASTHVPVGSIDYGIANQAVWVAHGLATAQPGMIALLAAFVILYGRNLWRWKGTAFEPSRKPDPPSRNLEAASAMARRMARSDKLKDTSALSAGGSVDVAGELGPPQGSAVGDTVVACRAPQRVGDATVDTVSTL